MLPDKTRVLRVLDSGTHVQVASEESTSEPTDSEAIDLRAAEAAAYPVSSDLRCFSHKPCASKLNHVESI